jgi:hypothetical protein
VLSNTQSTLAKDATVAVTLEHSSDTRGIIHVDEQAVRQPDRFKACIAYDSCTLHSTMTTMMTPQLLHEHQSGIYSADVMI